MFDAGCLDAGATGALAGTLLVLLLASSLYAVLLESLERSLGFVSDYTWLTVVVGVLLVIGALAFLSWTWALITLAAFAAAGTPIIVWSLWKDLSKRQELRRTLGGDDGDRP